MLKTGVGTFPSIRPRRVRSILYALTGELVELLAAITAGLLAARSGLLIF
jgi:hypothetical protein